MGEILILHSKTGQDLEYRAAQGSMDGLFNHTQGLVVQGLQDFAFQRGEGSALLGVGCTLDLIMLGDPWLGIRVGQGWTLQYCRSLQMIGG